jgi:plasmid replication initiation protein
MNEIVKYDNILNRISFTNFDENDFNLFMVLCSQMRDLGEEKPKFNYDYLMDLMNWDKTQRIDVFHEEIKKMADKLRVIGASVDISDDEWVSFDLFPTLRGNKKKRTLTVQINPEFKYILNDISKNFTRFELSEYVSLNGRYSKQLYQHLKQFRKTGWWQVSIEDIRRELSIPDSMETRKIVNKVINPSVEVIKTCKGFGDLEVEVLRSSRRGRAVEGYKFTWTADKQVPGQLTLDDLKPVKPAKKRGRPKKNQFNDYQQSTDEETIKEFEELFLEETNRKG